MLIYNLNDFWYNTTDPTRPACIPKEKWEQIDNCQKMEILRGLKESVDDEAILEQIDAEIYHLKYISDQVLEMMIESLGGSGQLEVAV